ncbi:helix-turn-helix transcriptional regulator [Arsenophonus sp.]|uniref:helix-turn-helix transcriptional regulator n=1 Tax=Arsenophonus sp. TaxID=1872640 RepID=UPI00387A1DCF
MKTCDVLTKHLISFMQRQKDYWHIKDIQSRFIYANSSAFILSGLPFNFDIEGKLNSECPLLWIECDKIRNYFPQKIIWEPGKSIFSIFSFHERKKKILQSAFVKKFPYYNQNEIVGTICHGRLIDPLLVSRYLFKPSNAPSFLTNHPPNNLFTTEELNVLFFAMKLFTNQEIALRLGTYCCVVEQIIRQICNKIDIHSRKQLRDYGIAEGFDNYFPLFLLKGLL